MEKIKKHSLHLLLIFLIVILMILIYIVYDNSIFVIESSFTDSIQAMSGVLSFIGGMLAVFVSIYISRKDTREKKEDTDIKRKTIVSYLYFTVCNLDDVFNKFEKDFYELLFNRQVYISDSVYSYHFSQLVQASDKLKEYKVSDMPHFKILITFVAIKENIEKIINLAGKFKEVHNDRLVFDEGFPVIQYHYQSEYEDMINAIKKVRLETKRMSVYLGVKYP